MDHNERLVELIPLIYSCFQITFFPKRHGSSAPYRYHKEPTVPDLLIALIDAGLKLKTSANFWFIPLVISQYVTWF